MIVPRWLPTLKRLQIRIHPTKIPEFALVIMRTTRNPRSTGIERKGRNDLGVIFERDFVRGGEGVDWGYLVFCFEVFVV